jgi:hypothetical protein
MTDNRGGAPLPEYVRVQRQWYRSNLTKARLANYSLEILVLLAGAAVSVSSTLKWGPWVPSVLGAAITVMTGMRTLFAWKENRRARAQALVEIDVEIARFERGAAPYDADDPKANGDLLQEAVIAVVLEETAVWAGREATTGSGTTGKPLGEP